jgi:hypothetical protein
MVIHKAKTKSIECEKLSFEKQFELKRGFIDITICEMSKETSIEAPNVTISTKRDESNMGLSFYDNKKIFYLPIDVAEKFPNLTFYSAWGCSIKEISKLNFKGMKHLKQLRLTINQIEIIDNDTFQDAVALEILLLGE